MIHMITGGSASRKSEYAEQQICLKQPDNRVYLATMQVLGELGAARVERHRMLREGKGFTTCEQYLDLCNLKLKNESVVLLEDLPNLCANEYFREDRVRKTADALAEEIAAFAECVHYLVIVTGNLFADGLHYTQETRDYMRYLAKVQNLLVPHSYRVTEVVYGIPIEI